MTTETTVQAPETRTASRWEDFIDVFFSPSELFQRRANDSWTVPIIVLCVVSTALYFAFLPVYTVLQESAMLNNPNLPPERIEAMQNAGGAMRVISGIFVPIATLLFIVLIAFVVWITGKITSIDLPYRRALMITTFIAFLGSVQQIAMNVLMSLKLRGGGQLDFVKDSSFGVLRFMDTANMNAGVIALLSRIDIFAIWTLVWFAIALMAAAKAPKTSAWIAASVYWLVGAIPYLASTMGQR